jgi:hypothetical protein
MADRLALIIAIESHQDPSLPTASHAETDAATLARALVPLGFPRTEQTILLGNQATRTAIASRLRKLVKNPPGSELLFVFFIGHAFAQEGHSYLACHDTQPDDLAETSLPVKTLLDALTGSGCQRFVLFLDARTGLADSTFSVTEIESFFGQQPAGVAFLACDEREQSHFSGSLKSGIWLHHVLEALTAKAPRALEGGSLLTADSLQAHLEQEIPRTLRSTFREAPVQTPLRFGPATRGRFLVADVTGALTSSTPTADPRLQPLKRGALRSETTGKVRSLAGFRKFHRLPERVNASSRKFVSDLAHDDVKQDVDEIYAALREALAYKRRDVEGSADRSSGFVRTPDFEYAVSVDLADDDPTTIVWRREVASIRSPDVILSKPFQQVFGGIFDTLVFEFTRPFDLEAWVDCIEEQLPEGVKLRTSSDCSSCDVHVRGFAGVIRLFRDRVEIQGTKTPGSKGLVEAFLHFQDLFSGRRDLQALPLIEGVEG